MNGRSPDVTQLPFLTHIGSALSKAAFGEDICSLLSVTTGSLIKTVSYQ
jgi:hypothetical protein